MNKDFRQYLKVAINLVIALVVLLLIVFLVPRLLLFFMPFVIGWIIAAIANPLVHLLEKKLKIRRKAVSVFVIVLVIAAVMGALYWIVWTLVTQGIEFITTLPDTWKSFEADLQDVGNKWTVFYNKLPLDVKDTLNSISENLSSYIGTFVGKVSSPTVNAIGNFAKSIPNAIISIVMCLLSSYFFVAEREFLNNFFKKYIPLSIQQKWTLGYHSMKKAVGGYFLAQLRIEVFMYVLLVIGLMILHINYAFLFALLIAVLDLLPVFGTGTVLIPWAIIQILSADYKTAIGLLIIWGVGQLIRQLIQPKFIGDSIGVKPIPTLFLLFIGYKLASVVGMIVAVPIGIILMNLNDAGVFDTTMNSVRLLVKKVNDFRRLDQEDLDDIRADEPEDLIDRESHSGFSNAEEDVIDWLGDNKYNDIKRELIEKLREKKEKKGSDK